MGSKLRNPVLAAGLYDLNFAETKGSGTRNMRSLLHQLFDWLKISWPTGHVTWVNYLYSTAKRQ
ncbi:hypothetical protein [Halomonas sp. 141]|uniref:hypothetical protein n=1 Tax=Halomonas sp. 141 TaxID=2056666 RepID=UPI002FCDBE57